MTTQGTSPTRDDDDLIVAGLCLDLERPREAQRILARLIDDGADDPEVYLTMAQASFELRETRACVDWARRALLLDAGSEWGWLLLSAATSRNGDHHDALAAAKNAIEIDPDDWRTHAQRVAVDVENGYIVEDTWDAAQRAIALAPDDPGPYLVSARLAHAKGFLDGAEKFYRKVLSLEPGHGLATRQLARIRLDGNAMGEATAAFAGMLSQNPGSRGLAIRLRRAVLRTLEWVNGILLVALILGGLLVILGDSTGSRVVMSGTLGGVLVLTVGGMAVALRHYFRTFGDGAADFARRLPRLSPPLVVLAAMQALALVLSAVVAVLLLVPAGGLSAAIAVCAIGAVGLVFAGLVYAGVMRAIL